MAEDSRITSVKVNLIRFCSKFYFIYICFVFLLCLDTGFCDNSFIPSSAEFSQHIVIKPKFYHGREKREISSTKEVDGLHIHDVTISYVVDGTDYILDLKLNHDLIPKNHFVKVQKDGKHVMNKPSYEDIDLCHYKGKIRGVDNSWVAVSTCNGLHGVLYDGSAMHYIKKRSNDTENSLNDEHLFYRHENIIQNTSCGHTDEKKHNHNARLKRQTLEDATTSIHAPYNAKQSSRYLELLLVVDNQQYRALEQNITKVYQYCKDISNIVNALYTPLNIFVALIGVVVWTENDEINISENGDLTLNNFLHYRRTFLVLNHPNDNAQLLTRQIFSGGVVGKALKGPICTYKFSGGINAVSTGTLAAVATTVAHTIGHNFGMEHDTPICSCPDKSCIMSPHFSNTLKSHWSSCSVDDLVHAFEHGMDSCLRNKPETLFDGPVCGNGFLEPGEQCDCGLKDFCENPCCNATTCMLTENSICAMGECCDLKTCTPKKAGILCRNNDQECDLPEYCTGKSEYCPADVFKRNTEPCNKGESYCYKGSCKSLSNQCRLLWGPTGQPSKNACYSNNKVGNRYGNCGYNYTNQQYKRCEEENVFCGTLHCHHLNGRLEYGMESVSILSHSFINYQGSIVPCRSAIIDLGLNVPDAGQVPEGAKCGDEKMCVNRQCVSIKTLPEVSCPNNCNGNGTCNSLGHCHCDVGFAPPYCDAPGPGGSIDSGPVINPDDLVVLTTDTSATDLYEPSTNPPSLDLSNSSDGPTATLNDSLSSLLESNLYPASNDFSNHTIINPKFYHAREKREILSTNQNKASHVHDITISYEADGNEYILDLKLNHDLIPKNHFVKIQKDGKHVINKPSYEDIDLCHYQGKIRGVDNSWVAVSTCNGLQGVLYDGHTMQYIQKRKDDYEEGLSGDHFLYKHEDLVQNNVCGYQGGAPHHHKHDSKQNEFNRILRYKRDTSRNPEPKIRGPYNANKQSRYVELLLVVDNKEYKALGESASKVHHHCKDIANIINALYSPLNIFVALIGVVIWTENDEIFLSNNGDTTLSNFLHYRRERLVKDHPNDNAQLLTREQFDGGVVGKALKGPICTYEFSGGVSMDHSNIVGLVATTVAHEMGHNFGMEHDTSECDCPDERCIMAPSSSSLSPNHWSSCSLEYLAIAFEQGMDYCLRNKPERLFDSPVCGNGFVEAGEQCDCGLKDRCDNPCCNASTCMLHQNASCATGECCDLLTCRPKKAGTICRTDDHECDLPEYCTGESEYCPPDVFKRNTELCDDGQSFCYQGSCRSRTDQCRLLWGPSGSSSGDECYRWNTKGNRNGNCGYNRINQSYVKCHEENIFCGMLQCQHLNERLEFGMESVAILSHNFINTAGSIIPCRTAIVDLGLNQVDPGLAPDGAKCGDGKMCVNQKCMAVESLRAGVHSCPNDCNGNGICNSLGHCHCNTGFAPPYCDVPGPGGSEDSGPASDPNARKEVIVALYVIFLGIVPSIALIFLLSYYVRHNPVVWWKKPSGSQPSQKSPPKQNGVQKHAPRATASPYRSTIPQSISSSIGTHSPDELSSSLLHSDTDSTSPSNGIQNNNFFGHFKGFSITPISKSVQEEPVPASTASAFVAPKPINLNTDRRNGKNIALVHPTTKSNVVDNKAPTRAAPPVPIAPTVPSVHSALSRSQTQVKQPVNKIVNRSQSIARPTALSVAVQGTNSTSMAPALPPPNPGTHPRPLISDPILEGSTCTAKELISPLKHSNSIPMRAAPELPIVPLKRPLSSPEDAIHSVVLPDELPKKPKEGGTALNRIASFLKSQTEKPKVSSSNTNSLPRNPNHQLKSSKSIEKNSLRNLQISNPIPQKDIVLPDGSIPVIADSDDEDTAKMVVMRAQSMRAPNTAQRPAIPTFGSMRQPSGLKRPTSIPVGNRPSSPPPPRPPQPKIDTGVVSVSGYPNPPEKSKTSFINKIPGLPGYQKPAPSKPNNTYDDCISESKSAPLANISEEMSPSSTDNIYAVIEESPPNEINTFASRKFGQKVSSPPIVSPKSNSLSPPHDEYKSPKPIGSSASGSSESVSLLGEIVSEIQNRNFDSIYSTSSLARKKKEKQLAEQQAEDDSVSFLDKSSNLGSNSSLGTYVNTSSIYKTPGSEYSTMTACPSTTSSGYITPSAVNAAAKNSNTKFESTPKPLSNVSSFKAPSETKPFSSTFQRQPGPIASSFKNDNNENKNNAIINKAPPSPTQKTKPPFNRSVTPPHLKSTSTNKVPAVRNVPSSPKNLPKTGGKTTNSPDVVQSCGTTKSQIATKTPDVLGNSAAKPVVTNKTVDLTAKPSISSTKPVTLPSVNKVNRPRPKVSTNLNDKKKVTVPPKPASKPDIKNNVKQPVLNKANSDVGKIGIKTMLETNSDVGSKQMPTAARMAATKTSNVASLQQKFEGSKK